MADEPEARKLIDPVHQSIWATGGIVKNFKLLRFAKYALILGVALFVMGLTPAHADTIYNISGTFSNGSSLTGSVTVDAAGNITGGTFTLGTGTGVSSPISFSALDGAAQIDPGVFAAMFATTGNPTGAPFITIVFSAGALCTDASSCTGEVTQFSLDGENFTELTSGGVTNTPEPSTYLLLGSGLLGLGLLSRKRLATNPS
jgi:hypothetical protein